ncbi:MAG: acetyl-CoA acetyltransferase [Acidimicrobiales bacterium]
MPSSSRIADPRTPVLVGVGTAQDSAPVVELMTAACRSAALDAAAPALLPALDRIVVPQGSWALPDPARAVAARLGARSARTYLGQVGVSQQELIDDALESIAAGRADVVMVVGGEARAFARRGGDESLGADEGVTPDVTLTRPADFIAPIEVAAGTVWPVVQQYALIENALAAHEHQDADALARDVSRLWARFNEVAQGNELAAFPAPRTAASIATPGPKNRPLSHPYNLWHSSQWTVDQAAALLLCSAERAGGAGVPADRYAFPHVALHASHAITLTARKDLHAWPAMAVLGRLAAGHLRAPLGELPLADVYSCFPSSVRVQQRALGLDPEGTPTVTGGMAFAGGPFNNYVLQSTAALIRLLRHRPAERGLVTTVSGMLSKPGLAVWSCSPPPPGRGTLMADVADDAAAATETLPVAAPEASRGPATVASYTVTYETGADGAGDPPRPRRTVIVADLGDGRRTAAACEDESLARRALSESLIGRPVHIDGATFTP